LAAVHSQRLALAGLLALTLLQFLWETLLAPLRPGGSWLALKALPLALLLAALLRGSRRASGLLALLLPFYFAEAHVRAMTEQGRHAFVAAVAAALAAATFVALLKRPGDRGTGNRERKQPERATRLD
jgi:uncharacterized membrane protein